MYSTAHSSIAIGGREEHLPYHNYIQPIHWILQIWDILEDVGSVG